MTERVKYEEGMELNSKGNRRGMQAKKGGRYTENSHMWAPMNVRKAQALAMLEKGSTYREISLATGLSHTTLARVKKGDHTIPRHIIDALRNVEDAKYTWLHHQLLDSIDEGVIDKASLLQRVTAAGILFDKRELKAGRATQRIEVGRSDEELQEEIERLRSEVIEVKVEG